MKRVGFLSNLLASLKSRLGWCPEPPFTSDIAMMYSRTQLPIINTSINTSFLLIVFGLGLGTVFQVVRAIEGEMPWAVLILAMIPFFIYLGYRSIQWWKLNPSFDKNLMRIISLTLGFYAISSISGILRNMHVWISDFVSNFVAYIANIYLLIWTASPIFMEVIFGYCLFKTASFIFKGQKLDYQNFKWPALCLGIYGIKNIIIPLSWFDYWFFNPPNYPYFYINLHLVYLLFWIIGGIAILFFAIKIFSEKKLRVRLVQLTFLSVGVSWLFKEIFSVMKDAFWFNIFNSWNSINGIILSILLVIVYGLVVIVSHYLLKGGKFQGRTLNLSLIAIFLYTSAMLFISYFPVTIFYHPTFGIHFSRVQSRYFTDILPPLPRSLPTYIMLVISGLLLRKTTVQGNSEANQLESEVTEEI